MCAFNVSTFHYKNRCKWLSYSTKFVIVPIGWLQEWQVHRDWENQDVHQKEYQSDKKLLEISGPADDCRGRVTRFEENHACSVHIAEILVSHF